MPATTRSLVKNKSPGEQKAKHESEVVTKRVEAVRRDIVDLKQELERLIQQGISGSRTDVGKLQ